ncbi:MAG: hypothetical protein MUE69_34405 [Myxococcota bacterium]|nr:hypothetical protein [Myxococcota bacterium]
MKRLPLLGRASEPKATSSVDAERLAVSPGAAGSSATVSPGAAGSSAAVSPGAAGSSATVRAWVVGAVEDAGALRFARVLAEALGVPLVREAEGLGDARAVAVGVELVGRVAPVVTIVIGGTLPTSAWRTELRGVQASIALAEPREELALRLAERWRAAASSDG